MSEPTKKNSQIISIVVGFVLIASMLLYFFSFQVRVNEVAVITTFGKPQQAISEPGLYWKWPYPFQDKYIYDARLQIFVSRVEQILTSDHKSIIVQTYVGWQVEDPIKFLSRVGRIDKAPKSLEGLIRTHTASVIASNMFAQFVAERNENEQISEDNFAAIEGIIKNLINEGKGGSKENLGIVVKDFGIRTLKLPQKTTEKVFERMRAEQDRLAQRSIAEGLSKYTELTSKADSEKKKKLIDAQALAKEKKGKADATAAQFYQIFAEEKELAIWLRKLESLEKLLGKKTTLLVDPSTPPFDLLRNTKFPQPQNQQASEEKQDSEKDQNPKKDEETQDSEEEK